MPGKRPLQPPYDVVLSNECFEHFHCPMRDIDRICTLLRPGGCLAIMTELWSDVDQFANWTYTRDKPHVSFFHASTLHFLEQRYPLKLCWLYQRRLALFRREIIPSQAQTKTSS